MRVDVGVGKGVEGTKRVSVIAGVDIVTGAAGTHDANSRVKRIDNKNLRMSIALYLWCQMRLVKPQCRLQ